MNSSFSNLACGIDLITKYFVYKSLSLMAPNRLLLLLFCTTQFILAQRISYKIPDSLIKKNYTYLDDKIFELKDDSTKAAVYLFTYLHKAKNEQNAKEIVNGYQNIIYQSPQSIKSVYADSMLYAAKKSRDNALIGSAYLSKGVVYYGQKKLDNALDNFTRANNYISRTTDQYLIHKVKYNIANIKSYLGYCDEAISLFKECVSYYKDKNSRPYLNSLHSLGLCYNKIGNYGLCSHINNLGLAESIRLDDKDVNPYFIHSEGINQYFKANYQLAIKSIESSLPGIKAYNDFANESIGNFYIGKSYWQLKKYDKALPYFQKVDQIFKDKGYIRPDIREVYELQIAYYKTNNNLQAQLYSIDQLLKADNLLNESYKYLVSKIHKEYNTKELIFEKEKIREELNLDKKYINIFVGAILSLFTVLFFLTYKHFKNKRIYKQKFDELMMKMNDENTIRQKSKNGKPEIADINPETVAVILKQLEKFEQDRKFLEKNLTLSKLSTIFNSNPKYLSLIISHHREKGFTKYINDLKIDYLISLLKENKAVRKYTNKALAEEIGFSSTQRFARAFLAKTGMPTQYFIEQIQKENIPLSQ